MNKLARKVTTIALSLVMLLSSSNLAILGQNVYAATNSAATDTRQGFYGFELTSLKTMPELESNVFIFKHIKTGAQLMYIQNNDVQRVFSISFRTPAENNTGVNHIIEHSVLDGSKNYPVKSPFKEMLKGSLGSFINAMTGPDYTTYPVASSNEQDLKNLMGVYLDAVFNPSVTTDSNIFKQEAWRYDLPSENSPLTINGVVFNEMKGNYSNPQWLLNNAINQSLFPNTTYKWDSGGKPESIPDLTKEQLVSTYNKNYTPSNSYIYLYGKLDIGSYLSFIDQNYLSKYEKSNNDTSIKAQEPLSDIPVKTVSYPVAAESDTNKKTYLSLDFVTGNIEDKETNVALSFLNYLLMGTDNAPLKKALTDTGIAENVSSSFNIGELQPVFSITALNSNETSMDIFQNTIMNTLKDVAEKGFDKDFLDSSISSYEISNRSEKILMPILGGNGLILSQTALSTWIHDLDPMMYFETASVIKRIKESDTNQYFKELINKYFLSNNYHSLVVLKPEAGLESKNAQKDKEALETIKAKMGKNGESLIIKNTEAFNTWQKTEDSKEALKSLPKLSLKDIKPEFPELKYNVEDESGIKVLTHKADLNGFSSVSLYFDTSKVPQEKLHYLHLLSSLLGNVNTSQHSYQELSNEMSKYMSAPITFVTTSAANSKDTNKYSPKMTAGFLVPDENIPQSFSIASELFTSSKFDDKERIKQIIEQNKSILQMMYASGSGTLALLKTNSYMSESGRYNEELAGYPYYKFLEDTYNNFDSKWEEISKNLEETYKLVFNKNGLLASQSGSENGTQAFKNELKRISSSLSSEVLPEQKYSFAQPDKNIAFSSTAKVQTVIQVGDFVKAGYSYNGKMLVLQNVLNMGYLWNKVRTNGGAYGVQSAFSPDGNVILASMRDPNLAETLDAFKGSVDYLKNFNATDEEMSNYIIGAVREFINLKNAGPLMEGILCDSMYLTEATADDYLKMEIEALSTTAEDIRSYADMLDKVLQQNIYFVEGSKEKIEQNRQLFNKIEENKE